MNAERDLLLRLVGPDQEVWYDMIGCWWCGRSPWSIDNTDGKPDYSHEDDCPWAEARRLLGLPDVADD